MPTINSSISTIKGAVDFSGGLTVGYFLQYQIDGNFRLVAVPSTNPGGANGSLQYNASGAFGGAAAIIYLTSGRLLTVTAQATTDTPLTLYNSNQGLTFNPSDALTVANATLTDSVNQYQVSPALRLECHSWNTTSLTDNRVDVRSCVLPIPGSSPYGIYKIQHQLNGGGYYDMMDVRGTGVINFYGPGNNGTVSIGLTGVNSLITLDTRDASASSTAITFQALGVQKAVFQVASTSAILQASAGIALRMISNANKEVFYADTNGNVNIGALASAGAKLQITSIDTSTKGLVVKSAVGQTANLQEWQDSNGNPLALIDSAGKIQSGNTRIWTNGGESRIEAMGGSQLTLNGNSSASVVIAPSYTTSGTFRFGVPSAGYVNINLLNAGTATVGEMGIDSVNQFYLKPGSNYGLRVISNAIGTPTVIIKGINSQTANLQEWQDSNGNLLAYINANGCYISGNVSGIAVDTISGYSTNQVKTVRLVVGANLTGTDIPLTVKGAASQTANLQEWQDINAVIQFGLGPTGQIKTNQSAAATTLGSVTNKLPIYDAAGTLIGYIPVYNSIT
jgi:hypothetical protein